MEKTVNEPSGLAVNGSRAAIHIQKPTFREQKHPKQVLKERELSFPVNKIMYLAESLELMSLTERKIESIALSTIDIKMGSVERHSKEDRSCKVSSPGLNFTLDLSSISSTAESDDSEEETFFRCDSKSSKKEGIRSLNLSLETNGDVHHENPKRGNCDLVSIYVNAVENQDLVRYFRPCHTCKEPCCVCPDLSYRCESRKEALPSNSKINKAVETDVNVTRLEYSPATRQKYRDFEYCPEIDFLPSCEEECPCRCTCREDRVFNSASEDSELIRHYTSGLAQATRSARALVRDLEVILHTMNGGTR